MYNFSRIFIAFLNDYICNIFAFKAVVSAAVTAEATASNFSLSSNSIVRAQTSSKIDQTQMCWWGGMSKYSS